MNERLEMSQNNTTVMPEVGTLPGELLEQVKAQMQERSRNEAELIDLGTLSGGKNEHVWTGGISLKQRIEAGEITVAEVDESVSVLNDFYVPITRGAPKRCGDGSSIEGYDDNDPRWYGRGLGLQTLGGTLGEAVGMRLTVGVPVDGKISLVGDMRIVAARPSVSSPGDHTDDRADGDKTGCGQVDGQPRKLPRYSNPEYAQVIEGTTDTIFGLAKVAPPQNAYISVQAEAVKLSQIPGYFPAPDVVLRELRALNSNGLEKLIRPHAEATLTINLVRGTTFHRDHYNARTNGKIQNFGLDVAEILAEHPDDGYAIIADAIATAMDLTDGSIRLFVRMPKSVPEN